MYSHESYSNESKNNISATDIVLGALILGGCGFLGICNYFGAAVVFQKIAEAIILAAFLWTLFAIFIRMNQIKRVARNVTALEEQVLNLTSLKAQLEELAIDISDLSGKVSESQTRFEHLKNYAENIREDLDQVRKIAEIRTAIENQIAEKQARRAQLKALSEEFIGE